jgi:D-sedoheptulose 7-phosphate isomerase
MVDIISALREGQEVREQTIHQLVPVIEKTSQVIIEALHSGHKILVFGNGGSAAETQHFVGELVGRYKAERRSLAGIALSTDTSVLTCIGNDYSYEEVFARQLYALANAGDVAIGLTTSGRSTNVLRGFQAAGEQGAVTVALTGQNGLHDVQTDYVLAVPSLITARVQEEHLAIIHCWCDAIDEAFA